MRRPVDQDGVVRIVNHSEPCTLPCLLGADDANTTILFMAQGMFVGDCVLAQLQTEDHQDLCTLFKKTFHSLVDHVKRTTCYGHTDDYKPLPASAVH